LHGNPYDGGHTLAAAVADLAAMTGVAVQRTCVDKGLLRAQPPEPVPGLDLGSDRWTTAALKREMKRRAAIELVIGHLKAEHRMGRNHLKRRECDRSNAVLVAVGYNFSLLLRWLAALLRTLVPDTHRLRPITQTRLTGAPNHSSRTTR
jgi:transposase, IS5 family